jgi:putative nucleotidyltransferase with HDIG domain
MVSRAAGLQVTSSVFREYNAQTFTDSACLPQNDDLRFRHFPAPYCPVVELTAGSFAAGELEGAYVGAREVMVRKFSEVNRELWLILSLFVIAAMINFVVGPHGMLLSFYSLPTIFSAYSYGRRHAISTAFASILLVVLVTYFNPEVLAQRGMVLSGEKWYELGVWAGTLILTAIAMGTLYERNLAKIRELRQTYQGVLMILRQFISKDKYTQNHSYRVSIYATQIAAEMGFDEERIEDVRAAALLHDIGKLDISRDILYKAARLTSVEYEEMRGHVTKGVDMLEPVGGSLRRVLPIILSHHDRFDGSGYTEKAGDEIPLEARILSVADAYDAIVSDRPYRKGSSPFEAREVIERGAGREFDPKVVQAFLVAFRKRSLEIPEVVV